MFFNRWRSLFLVALCGGVLAAQEASVFQEVQEIVAKLSEITKLSALRRVRYDTLSREGLREFLIRRIPEVTRPAEIRAEELTLKKFGLVPQDFDLKQSTVDLMTEQAAAFYDDKRKKLFLLEGSSGPLQQVALVHELAHALADQHFNLGQFVRNEGTTDDANLARLAVVEGQATWLMAEYMAQKQGTSLRQLPGLLRLFAGFSDAATGQFPQFDKAPLYLREVLLFPYTRGAIFQQEALNKLGDKAFRAVFTDPPVSSQQILHPELYFSRTAPAKPRPPVVPNPERYRLLTEGAVGEFDHTVLLKQYGQGDDAESLAAHWRGSWFRLHESRKPNGPLVLSYASEWRQEQDAAAFFVQYERVLRGKWRTFEELRRTSNELVGRGDDGYFRLRREQATITSLEGLPDAPAAIN